MASYGAYHRDARNRATHFIGVPLIMFALLIALGWVQIPVAGQKLSAAPVVLTATLAYYVFLDVAMGAAMALFSCLLLYGAQATGALPFSKSLGVFAAAFVLGWALQLLGHAFEGRKPALVDNLFQIIVAPLFLMAEVFFALGFKRELRERVSALLARDDATAAGRPLVRPHL